MNVDTQKSAVVLIEFQNQWTNKGVDRYLVSDCTATMNGFFQWKTERKYHGKVVNHLKAIDWLSHM